MISVAVSLIVARIVLITTSAIVGAVAGELACVDAHRDQFDDALDRVLVDHHCGSSH